MGPLRRKLSTLEAWITGQRKDQSVGTRTALPVVEEDSAFSTVDHPSSEVKSIGKLELSSGVAIYSRA